MSTEPREDEDQEMAADDSREPETGSFAEAADPREPETGSAVREPETGS